MAQKTQPAVTAPTASEAADPDALYARLAREFGPALVRIARAHEADADLRRDLLQDLHVALWRSLRGYDGRCSLRTWVYRVAHNTATTYIAKCRRSRSGLLRTLDELEAHVVVGDVDTSASAVNHDQTAARLYAMIGRLAPLDSQIMLLYLEDLEAAEIAAITGLGPANVATRIHRIKQLLIRLYHSEDPRHE